MLIFTPFATMATGDTFLGYIFGDFGNPSEEIEFFSSKMTIYRDPEVRQSFHRCQKKAEVEGYTPDPLE